MKRLLINIVTAFAIVLTAGLQSSCNSRIYTLLQDVETYIDARPDSALATLQTIQESQIHGRATKALYNLLTVEAMEKCDSIITDSNAIAPALDYYSRGKDYLHYFQTLFYLGCIQKDSGNCSGATLTFSHAEELSEMIDNNPHWMGLLYSQLSGVCGMCYDSEEENRYALLSYENFVRTGNKKRINIAKYSLALSYHGLLDWVKADSLYKELIADPNIDKTLRGQALSNAGHMQTVKDDPDYEQAVNYFNEAINTIGGLERLRHYGAYALALAKTNKIAEAHSVLSQMEKICEGTDREEYFYWKSQVDAVNHDYEAGYKDLKHALILQNDIIEMIMNQSAAKAQRDYQTSQRIQAEQKVHKRNITILIIVAVCIVLLLLCLLWITNQTKRSRELEADFLIKQEAIRIQLEEMEQRQKEEKKNLQDEYIKIYQNQFEEYRRLSLLVLDNEIISHRTEEQRYRNLINQMQKIVEGILDDEEGQEKFEQLVNQRMDGIMIKFRKDFPKMSESQLRMVCLYFAGFKSNVIAMIFNVNQHFVHVNKNRIRDKIIKSQSENKTMYLSLIKPEQRRRDVEL